MIFVHYPKTAGTSISIALGIRKSHKSATQWIKELGMDYFDQFSFSVHRNPYHREESFYKYLKKRNPKMFPDFGSYIEKYYIRHEAKYKEMHEPFLDFISYKGEIAVKCLLCYENLKEDWRSMGLGDLPYINQSKGDVEWTNKQREIIYNHYKKDFDEFGYIA